MIMKNQKVNCLLIALSGALCLSACNSGTSSSPTPTPTPSPSPTPTPTPPGPTPTPTPVAGESGVYAVSAFSLSMSFATQPSAANWWSWPLDKMPLSIYYWGNDAGLSSSVALLGNPAVYWLTWITTIMLGYLWATRQADFRAGFLFLAICAQYLPYALIARISFIYYFYSVTPFLILGISYFIYLAYRTEKPVYKYVVYAYLLVNIVLFALFFSSLAGLEVPRSYTLHWLRWMAGWNF